MQNSENNSNFSYELDRIPNIRSIGIIYSEVKREYFPTEEQYITEKDALKDAKLIASELEKLKFEVVLFPGDENLTYNLQKNKPDMVFNLVDSVKGKEYLSSTIAGLLEVINIPYTGSGLLGLALCYNKYLTKRLMRTYGLPVPNFQLFSTPNDLVDTELRYPLICKLNEIHGAVEINESSVVENEKELREKLKFLISTYDQPVVVEEFISGREITAMLLQGINLKVYLAEKMFNKPDKKYVFATFNDQWGEFDSNKDTWPYKYSKYEDKNLTGLVRKAFDVVKMTDYGKFDIRLDSSGRYYFIDANVNPAFGPKELSTSMGLIIEELYGISFEDILKRLIINSFLLE